jgi:hypothetical protein
MNSIEWVLFKNDKEGQILNQIYRNCYCSNHPDLQRCSIMFNQIVRHLQKNTTYSISQIINRFIIENDDLGNLKRHILVTYLDLDNYLRYKKRL